MPDLLFFFWLLLLLECSPPAAAAALAGVLVEMETAEGAEVLLVEAALVEAAEVPRDCFSAFEAAAEVPFLLLGVAEVDDAELLLLFSGVSLSRSPLFAVDEVDKVVVEDLLDEVLALVLLSLLLEPLPAVEVLELLIEARFPLLLLLLVGAGADEVVVVEEAAELALFSVVFSVAVLLRDESLEVEALGVAAAVVVVENEEVLVRPRTVLAVVEPPSSAVAVDVEVAEAEEAFADLPDTDADR